MNKSYRPIVFIFQKICWSYQTFWSPIPTKPTTMTSSKARNAKMNKTQAKSRSLRSVRFKRSWLRMKLRMRSLLSWTKSCSRLRYLWLWSSMILETQLYLSRTVSTSSFQKWVKQTDTRRCLNKWPRLGNNSNRKEIWNRRRFKRWTHHLLFRIIWKKYKVK